MKLLLLSLCFTLFAIKSYACPTFELSNLTCKDSINDEEDFSIDNIKMSKSNNSTYVLETLGSEYSSTINFPSAESDEDEITYEYFCDEGEITFKESYRFITAKQKFTFIKNGFSVQGNEVALTERCDNTTCTKTYFINPVDYTCTHN